MKQIICLLFLVFSACKTEIPVAGQNEKPKEYLRWVDDIAANDSLESPEFQLCNDENLAMQYFNDSKGLLYDGGMIAVYDTFKNTYVKPVGVNDSGLVRIRFIVNCKGETGRFRILQSDEYYQETVLDEKITEQLLKTTQNIKGWQIKEYQNISRDYYQYLIFKIQGGELVKILP